MSFLTVWNAGTLKLLKFVFVFTAGAVAHGQPACRDLWKEGDFGATWLQKPGIVSFLQDDKKADLGPAIASVSTDFLLSSSLDLDQRVLKNCPDRTLAALLDRFQKAYLRRLGVTEDIRPTHVAFQGLAASGEEFTRLQKAVRAVPAGYGKRGSLAFLQSLFKGAFIEKGVVVLGGTLEQRARLKMAYQKACEGFSLCPLWDPTFLLRVAILPGEAKAEYDSSLGALRLSQDLLIDESELKQLVIVHELAHAALWRLQQTSGEDPREKFADFSAWQKPSGKLTTPVRETEAVWKDALSEASKNSRYSLLPDPVVLAQKIDGNLLDGFVFAKSIRETESSGDVAEDMADHIAAYVIAPGRFCYGKKPVAPRKFEWVAKWVFGLKQTLACEKVL